jgi:hypothetical protein
LDDFMMGVLYGFLNFTLLSSRRIIELRPWCLGLPADEAQF